MNKLTLYSKQFWLVLSMGCIVLTAMALTLKPIAPGIEVLYGEVPIANKHATFEIENGTDWETYYGTQWGDETDEVRTYTIKNTGDAPLTIQDVSIRNLSDDEDFIIVEEPVNHTVAPGDISIFKVGFRFKDLGVSAAEIGITTNDPVTPIYTIYMMANVIECIQCPNRHTEGRKCDECVTGFINPPLCADCENPKHGGENCETCADKYNPLTYPACNECRSPYMTQDCTTCVFPGQDYENYCNSCEDPTRVWPRCYLGEE